MLVIFYEMLYEIIDIIFNFLVYKTYSPAGLLCIEGLSM